MARPSRRSQLGISSSLRAAGCAAVLALLSACASQGPTVSATQQAAVYKAHARGNYVPPGPPNDPWGPYIEEASRRFDVPDRWIRALMHVESGGQEYQNGQLITSSAGAMGLMQVMPGTYEELQARYGLGSDPYDPHDNIIAGVAYMRELYDIYGSPAFLAAYNGGPARLDDYLADFRPLPTETRHYVAMIAPAIEGTYPHHRSPAEAYAMNDIPVDIAPGLRYGGGQVLLASARHVSRGTERHAKSRHTTSRGRTEYARLTGSKSGPRKGIVRVALRVPAQPSKHGRHDFALIDRAEAEPIPTHPGSVGGWAIQVGAYSSPKLAERAVSEARSDAHKTLGKSHSRVASVRSGHETLYRARLTGMSKEAATKACKKLAHGHSGCIVLSPSAQS